MGGLFVIYVYYLDLSMCVLQEKEKQKLARAEKAASRLKEKAVKQHQHFKEAIKILRQHRMGAMVGVAGRRG